MNARVGIAGFAQDSTAAIYSNGRVAACAENRARRVRSIGIRSGGWPEAALAAVQRQLGVERLPSEWATAEADVHEALPGGRLLPHHRSHALTSFVSSGLKRAVVLVCDSSRDNTDSFWLGDETGIHLLPRRTSAPASIGRRLAQAASDAGMPASTGLRDLELVGRQPGTIAESILKRFADELLNLAEALKTARSDVSTLPLCVGGGLFYNGFFNLRLRQSRLFPSVFVPPDPGNSGLSVGCALPEHYSGPPLTAFLGPSFEDEEIKAVLDNCKLTYRYGSAATQVELACASLSRGRLVGWFMGPMEWGPRALGNRSILASPFSRYVSANLNQFLKHRPAHHPYSLSVLEADTERLFREHVPSPFMEAEAEVNRNDTNLTSLTGPGTRLRIQTVAPGSGRFADLLQAFKECTGTGALVNTSFNGFHEPIVVTPRDAVRVFFGSGIDALAIGHFWLEK